MNFEFVTPQTVSEAVSANEDGARWFAGGTDLIPELKNDLVATLRLVNLDGSIVWEPSADPGRVFTAAVWGPDGKSYAFVTAPACTDCTVTGP